MNNCIFLLFGATGDLAKRKLIPALYKLIADKKLDNFVILGTAIDDVTSVQMLEKAKPFIGSINDTVWQTLQERTYYQPTNFVYEENFTELKDRVESLEKKYDLSGNRIFYFSVSADFFCSITHHIANVGLAKKTMPEDATWHRLVYEKPFGRDTETAHEINECIARYFDESQIFRIDHYLTKEVVSNIALLRFTNCVLEPLWNNRFIDHVQIVLDETLDIEGRGGYYDKYGAIRDVVQNHMLELLALIAMEAPEKLTGDFIRTERANVIKKIRFVDGITGQYEGYTKDPAVLPHSHTETFAALKFFVENKRWSGVPFYLKTGKCLDTKETIIHIKFKQVDCLLLRGCPTDSNWLTIRIAPEALFSLKLFAKKPGTLTELTPVEMEFCHSAVFGPQTPEAYEVLLEEVLKGEQSISVRFDEIEYAWKVIDNVIAQKLMLYPYECGTGGPKELKDFEQKHGMRWRS